MGTSALPSNLCRVWPGLPALLTKRGNVVSTVRVWCAFWRLSDTCMPSPRNITPAGLLYTPSMPIAASRAGFLKNSILWLVFVSSPPAHAFITFTAAIMVRQHNLIFLI